MSRAAEAVRAGIRRLAGMKKKADGIALDDARTRDEGERQQRAGRTQEAHARRRHRPRP